MKYFYVNFYKVGSIGNPTLSRPDSNYVIEDFWKISQISMHLLDFSNILGHLGDIAQISRHLGDTAQISRHLGDFSNIQENCGNSQKSTHLQDFSNIWTFLLHFFCDYFY